MFQKNPQLKEKMRFVVLCMDAAKLSLLNVPPLETLKRIAKDATVKGMYFCFSSDNPFLNKELRTPKACV